MKKALIISSIRFPKDFFEEQKFHEYTHSPEWVKTLCELSKTGFLLKKLGWSVDTKHTRDICQGKDPVDLNEYDHIFINLDLPGFPSYPMISPDFRKQLHDNLDKTTRICCDPNEMDLSRTLLENEAGFRKQHGNKFNWANKHFADQDDFERWIKINKTLMIHKPMIISTFLDHTEDEKIACYGETLGKNVICVGYMDFFPAIPKIPFEDKTKQIAKCVRNFH